MPSPFARLVSFLACLMLLAWPAGGSQADARPSAPALEGFFAAAFHSEYGDTQRDTLIRWEIPLSLYVVGETTKEDRQTLEALLKSLKANVPGLPEISFAKTEAEANVIISFVPYAEMAEALVDYVPDNWGFTNCFSDDVSIRYGLIAIATDVAGQKDRIHLIQEEFVNMLGLTDDLDFAPESIIYQPYTVTQALADMDYEMLSLLYSPHVAYGMNREEAKAALESACEKQ